MLNLAGMPKFLQNQAPQFMMKNSCQGIFPQQSASIRAKLYHKDGDNCCDENEHDRERCKSCRDNVTLERPEGDAALLAVSEGPHRLSAAGIVVRSPCRFSALISKSSHVSPLSAISLRQPPGELEDG
jgi:hypothetical protein